MLLNTRRGERIFAVMKDHLQLVAMSQVDETGQSVTTTPMGAVFGLLAAGDIATAIMFQDDGISKTFVTT